MNGLASRLGNPIGLTGARRVWPLRQHLSTLLIVATLLTFVLVAGAMMAWRIPQIERESARALRDQAERISARMELLMGTRQDGMQFVAALLSSTPQSQRSAVLDEVGHRVGLASAAYHVSPQGRVEAVGLDPDLRRRRQEVLGRDLSTSPLFQAIAQGAATMWTGQYTCLLSGERCVALGVRGPDGTVLITELTYAGLARLAETAADGRSSSVWIVERGGAIVADTDRVRGANGLGISLSTWPTAQIDLTEERALQTFRHAGQRYQVAIAHAPQLDWYFVGMAPMGLGDPEVQAEIGYALLSLMGCLLMGLLTAPFWANRIAQLLQALVARATQSNKAAVRDLAWPRGPVLEFNALADDLAAMEQALWEREEKSKSIFNAAPVPMLAATASSPVRVLDVNEAWCREYMRTRERVVGRQLRDLDLLWSPQEMDMFLGAAHDEQAFVEARLRRGDGQEMLQRVFRSPPIPLNNEALRIWATVDIAPIRRIEQELRVLNQELESRVEQRTHALAASNETLECTLEQVQVAQDGLVLTEKMAALGGLVAGVAHELNTPLGNGVMAVSAMADALHGFKASMPSGLKRSDLQRFVDNVTHGTDIAERNLRRAADLVQSFKQVAVDQTSSQRRSFEVSEVVHEIVVSLRPSFSRKPYQIEVDVPAAGLRLDSYPGALGQTIANLVLNAVAHAFEGLDHGTVRISAWRDDSDGRIVLRVADDGKGVPAAILPRIFDPFVTTKQGRGGTGLGLHISYNAIVDLLGGSLTVHSVEGQGAVFEMRLPDKAPKS